MTLLIIHKRQTVKLVICTPSRKELRRRKYDLMI